MSKCLMRPLRLLSGMWRCEKTESQYQCPPSGLLWVGSHQHDSINQHDIRSADSDGKRPRPDAGRSSRMSPGSTGSAGTHVLSSPGHRESEESDENEESQETAPVIT